MKPESAIRAASWLSYIVGFGTLLSIGPGLAYNLYFGSSVGSLFGRPTYGDFIGSNPIGQLWGFSGALVFGITFLVAAGAEVVTGHWLRKSLKKGGVLGAILAPSIVAFAILFVLPGWFLVTPVLVALLLIGWKTLR
ncbi:MAG: hypothetical protein HY296_02300 [Thaumarchaeota archaeon]|nr:hypothetical protein [Nitrososphaerota archaeon]